MDLAVKLLKRWWNNEIEKTKQRILDNTTEEERQELYRQPWRGALEFNLKHDTHFRLSALVAALGVVILVAVLLGWYL